MTKTLTEQWREGTLPDGYYYVQYDKCSPFIKDAYGMIELKKCIDSEKIKVLAPVPSYNEYNKLRKLPLKCFQLEEDNSALMVINKDMCKEIERLQKQLKEANEVIKWYDGLENILIGWELCTGQPKGTANKYLEKWGVK